MTRTEEGIHASTAIEYRTVPEEKEGERTELPARLLAGACTRPGLTSPQTVFDLLGDRG